MKRIRASVIFFFVFLLYASFLPNVNAQGTYQCEWDATNDLCYIVDSCDSNYTVPIDYQYVCQSRGEVNCLIDRDITFQCQPIPEVGASACYWQPFGTGANNGECVQVNNCTAGQTPPTVECARITNQSECQSIGTQQCTSPIGTNQFRCSWNSPSQTCVPITGAGGCSSGFYPDATYCLPHTDPQSCIDAVPTSCTTTPPQITDYYQCAWNNQTNTCGVGSAFCDFGNTPGSACSAFTNEANCRTAGGNGQFTCEQSTCGGEGQSCCTRSPGCGEGLYCDSIGNQPTCRANDEECGGRGEMCCGQTSTTPQCEGGLDCNQYNLCSGCGGLGETCCASDNCYFGLSCYEFGQRNFCGTSGCGDVGEACCTNPESPACWWGECLGDNTCGYTNEIPRGARLDTALGRIAIADPGVFLGQLVQLSAGFAGGIAFLFIIYGAFLVMTSTGDPKKLETGKQVISSAVSGLLLIIFSVFILGVLGVNILGIPGFTF